MEQYQELEHKAAGHDGTLTDTDGTLIFKPLNQREFAFYQSVQNGVEHSERQDQGDIPLESWMPVFLGVLNEGKNLSSDEKVTVITDGSSVHLDTKVTPAGDVPSQKYLVLQNLLAGFNKPNVLDIKLGKVLYDSDASDAKKLRMQEVSKTTTSGSLGFRICGMKIQRNSRCNDVLKDEHFEAGASDDEYIFVNKLLGRSRTKEDVKDAIDMFFAHDSLSVERRRQLKVMFLKRLQLFFNTLLDENVRMISSSLLFVYEGDVARWDEEQDADTILNESFMQEDSSDEEVETHPDSTGSTPQKTAVPLSSMSLIDFAHSRVTPGAGYDENVVEGVESLLEIFTDIAK
ncbi:inositol polyphosphate multikinase KNAG_0A04850 [Huiozyma naganishii CBS 8797]|uniref:Kinase n=1 Tax=Huiozyma naganishii (strain ATCC MYA-139 / BCRC 22969 / CBS 8797 / KCTC 17520 / NBRC 10181 / NCYC 3082 / Yp74L-3) TaxID=1071383 RepID=J7R030_HUIN7|nr:hypothetical protein KNAG_0A04850 [Kazachstania naganishii CBS 8797]CCK68155.1 hypothetical protein KNAG_0A04850 [Kazachstania naganishii CBS 8797]